MQSTSYHWFSECKNSERSNSKNNWKLGPNQRSWKSQVNSYELHVKSSKSKPKAQLLVVIFHFMFSLHFHRSKSKQKVQQIVLIFHFISSLHFLRLKSKQKVQLLVQIFHFNFSPALARIRIEAKGTTVSGNIFIFTVHFSATKRELGKR